jgi:hypothetical protein
MKPGEAKEASREQSSLLFFWGGGVGGEVLGSM